MAVQTPQSNAIILVNQMTTLAIQMYKMVLTMQDLQSRIGEQGTEATLQQFGTCALAPDGSPGAADPSPVQTNPMDPVLFPTMTQMVSYAQFAACAGFMNAMEQIINTPENMAIIAPFLGDS